MGGWFPTYHPHVVTTMLRDPVAVVGRNEGPLRQLHGGGISAVGIPFQVDEVARGLPAVALVFTELPTLLLAVRGISAVKGMLIFSF